MWKTISFLKRFRLSDENKFLESRQVRDSRLAERQILLMWVVVKGREARAIGWPHLRSPWVKEKKIFNFSLILVFSFLHVKDQVKQPPILHASIIHLFVHYHKDEDVE